MNQEVRLALWVQQLMRCPCCRHQLHLANGSFHCSSSSCGTTFPIVDGIPILINERSSIFSFEDFTRHRTTFFQDSGQTVGAIQKFLPTIDRNVKSSANYEHFVRLISLRPETSKVLVLGGGVAGEGIQPLLNADVELLETDVSFGPRTEMICDAHDIPFEDNSFDGVVAQAVLEHVVDPSRCVREIHRVLKRDGYVYAETPFMQQVHGGRYDFTRFTHLGHRWLFKDFDEIESGAACGPGMALAWAYQYFLLSFTSSELARMIIRGVSRLTAFWLRYFDRYLIDKPGALDAASGVYFLGRKSDSPLTHRELIELYRGALQRNKSSE